MANYTDVISLITLVHSCHSFCQFLDAVLETTYIVHFAIPSDRVKVNPCSGKYISSLLTCSSVVQR